MSTLTLLSRWAMLFTCLVTMATARHVTRTETDSSAINCLQDDQCWTAAQTVQLRGRTYCCTADHYLTIDAQHIDGRSSGWTMSSFSAAVSDLADPWQEVIGVKAGPTGHLGSADFDMSAGASNHDALGDDEGDNKDDDGADDNHYNDDVAELWLQTHVDDNYQRPFPIWLGGRAEDRGDRPASKASSPYRIISKREIPLAQHQPADLTGESPEQPDQKLGVTDVQPLVEETVRPMEAKAAQQISGLKAQTSGHCGQVVGAGKRRARSESVSSAPFEEDSETGSDVSDDVKVIEAGSDVNGGVMDIEAGSDVSGDAMDGPGETKKRGQSSRERPVIPGPAWQLGTGAGHLPGSQTGINKTGHAGGSEQNWLTRTDPHFHNPPTDQPHKAPGKPPLQLGLTSQKRLQAESAAFSKVSAPQRTATAAPTGISHTADLAIRCRCAHKWAETKVDDVFSLTALFTSLMGALTEVSGVTTLLQH